jgi:hypothetical protein
MLLKYASVVARSIFGLWYSISGGAWLVGHLLGRGVAHHEVAAGAIAFQAALTESRFMDPLLATTCLFGGVALLFRRTSPLGIVVLAPVVIVIFLFHVVLSGNWIWGTLNLFWFAGLAWPRRRAFATLWSYVESP